MLTPTTLKDASVDIVADCLGLSLYIYKSSVHVTNLPLNY